MSRPWDTDLAIYDDETALLDGLRRGDRYACSCMLKRYAPRLYRLSLQLVGDPDEAEDVLQEAFIRGCDRIDDFAGASSLGTWLHRIVVNTGLMHLRKRGRDAVALPEPESGQPEPMIEGLIDREAEPGSELLSRELVDRIEAAVLTLPDSLRAAFVLRDLEGLSTREAASALGIGESALKVRLHRARAALRAELAPYLHEHDPDDENGVVDP